MAHGPNFEFNCSKAASELRRHLNTLEDHAMAPPAPSSFPASTEKGIFWHSLHHRSCTDGQADIIHYSISKKCTYRIQQFIDIKYCYIEMYLYIYIWSQLTGFISRHVSCSRVYGAYYCIWRCQWLLVQEVRKQNSWDISYSYLFWPLTIPDCTQEEMNKRRLTKCLRVSKHWFISGHVETQNPICGVLQSAAQMSRAPAKSPGRTGGSRWDKSYSKLGRRGTGTTTQNEIGNRRNKLLISWFTYTSLSHSALLFFSPLKHFQIETPGMWIIN